MKLKRHKSKKKKKKKVPEKRIKEIIPINKVNYHLDKEIDKRYVTFNDSYLSSFCLWG